MPIIMPTAIPAFSPRDRPPEWPPLLLLVDVGFGIVEFLEGDDVGEVVGGDVLDIEDVVELEEPAHAIAPRSNPDAAHICVKNS